MLRDNVDFTRAPTFVIVMIEYNLNLSYSFLILDFRHCDDHIILSQEFLSYFVFRSSFKQKEIKENTIYRPRHAIE